MNIREKEKLSWVIIKRYVNLVIPIFLSCMFIWMLMKFNCFDNRFIYDIVESEWLELYYRDNSISLIEAVINSLFLVLFEGNSVFSTAFWMLNILFFGSYLAIFEGVVFWYCKKRSLLVYVFVLLAIVLTKNWYMSLFAFGTIFAYIYMCCGDNEIIKKYEKYKKYISGVAIVLGVFCAGYPTGMKATNIYQCFDFIVKIPYYIWHIIGAVFFLFGILLSEKIQVSFEKNMFKKLGSISYWIYIVHIPIIFCVSTKVFGAMYSFSKIYWIALAVSLIASIFVVILLSAFMTNVVGKRTKIILQKINMWLGEGTAC